MFARYIALLTLLLAGLYLLAPMFALKGQRLGVDRVEDKLFLYGVEMHGFGRFVKKDDDWFLEVGSGKVASKDEVADAYLNSWFVEIDDDQFDGTDCQSFNVFFAVKVSKYFGMTVATRVRSATEVLVDQPLGKANFCYASKEHFFPEGDAVSS